MIETSVVGSYPIPITIKHIRNAQENKTSWSEFFLPHIKKAVEDQLSAGIDIISTGQVRTDMISEFTRRISGIKEIKGEKYIISKLKFVKPITLYDLVYAKNLIPKNKKIKGILTGPYTLSKTCKITRDSGYKNIEELAFDFAEILNKEAKAIEYEVDNIQIDEPMFSIEYPEYGKKLISIVRKEIKKPIALHVCGDVSKIFEKLTKYQVDILDHEFVANPELINQISKTGFSQKIGYGCVNSYDGRIESVEEIVKNIEKAVKVFGEDKIILDPDCGLFGLGLRKIAYQKLENMVKARNKFYGINTIKAKKKKLTDKDWDKKGYFYILLDKQNKQIRVENYDYNHILQKIIYGDNAEAILNSVLKFKLTNEDQNGKRHYGYIATELQKAETALRNNLDYIQDRKLKIS
ncbi:MAG: methionine synthase [Nanoarchaeota archaeon]|nr:methionine synthase [Nanoarchaeota archaeon]MBU1027434.1 methionine synthase [Nanoarchaeota archaeon]